MKRRAFLAGTAAGTIALAAPAIVPGPSGGAQTPLRAPVPAAPKEQGVRPKAVTPPPDELESRIAAMAQLRAPDTALPAPDNGAGAGNGPRGGYALADFVRAQILRRWWPQLQSDAARGMPVAIRLKLSRAGVSVRSRSAVFPGTAYCSSTAWRSNVSACMSNSARA